MAVRQARRQLQFSGFEMGLIAVSFLVTVTAVFFLGLFVGKKNASYHAPTEDRVARIPVDDFTRYKRPAPIPAPPKEVKAEAPAAEATATAKADAPAPVAATAPKAPAVAAPSEPMGPEAPAAVATATPPATTVEPAKAADPAAAEAAKKAKEAAAAAKELAAKEKEEKEKAAAAEETGRGYTVQILATRKQADADALVKKLKSRGFAAYIKKISDGEGAWYRVRVGSYGAFSEARAMADKCRRDLGLGQAFVSTE